MSNKELELATLQEEHSELYVKAQELGVTVPEDLTVDFDTVETGRTVCASLQKLIRANAPETEEDADQAQATPASKSKKTKSKPATKKAAKPAAKSKAAKQESAMSTATKKAKPAKKAKKVAKKSNGQNKTAQVVALMKRAKGVTREEVLELTGWKAVSMQNLAKSTGIKMKVLDESRPFHYKVA